MFPTEQACIAYLFDLRWPEGFVCPSCGFSGPPWRLDKKPTLVRCPNCRKDISLTAGTIMHRTKLPVRTWFWAAYLVTSETTGISATQFARQLGISCHETAYQVLHKLRAAMVRPGREQIGGEDPVQIDETLIDMRLRRKGGDELSVATVVGAVEVRTSKAGNKYAGRIRLLAVPSNWKDVLERFVAENVLPGSHVTTDGNPGYANLKALGYKHKYIAMHGDPEKLNKYLPTIHVIFSNLKTWLLGTFHSVSERHLQAYLNEYVFRFNRRFYPMSSFNSVLGIGMHVPGPSYDDLYQRRWVHPTLGDAG